MIAHPRPLSSPRRWDHPSFPSTMRCRRARPGSPGPLLFALLFRGLAVAACLPALGWSLLRPPPFWLFPRLARCSCSARPRRVRSSFGAALLVGRCGPPGPLRVGWPVLLRVAPPRVVPPLGLPCSLASRSSSRRVVPARPSLRLRSDFGARSPSAGRAPRSRFPLLRAALARCARRGACFGSACSPCPGAGCGLLGGSVAQRKPVQTSRAGGRGAPSTSWPCGGPRQTHRWARRGLTEQIRAPPDDVPVVKPMKQVVLGYPRP